MGPGHCSSSPDRERPARCCRRPCRRVGPRPRPTTPTTRTTPTTPTTPPPSRRHPRARRCCPPARPSVARPRRCGRHRRRNRGGCRASPHGRADRGRRRRAPARRRPRSRRRRAGDGHGQVEQRSANASGCLDRIASGTARRHDAGQGGELVCAATSQGALECCETITGCQKHWHCRVRAVSLAAHVAWSTVTLRSGRLPQIA